tara:strand:- start:1 stop:153 length:153 start_codon:yes stop_codon:yes gene_type:complete
MSDPRGFEYLNILPRFQENQQMTTLTRRLIAANLRLTGQHHVATITLSVF